MNYGGAGNGTLITGQQDAIVDIDGMVALLSVDLQIATTGTTGSTTLITALSTSGDVKSASEGAAAATDSSVVIIIVVAVVTGACLCVIVAVLVFVAQSRRQNSHVVGEAVELCELGESADYSGTQGTLLARAASTDSSQLEDRWLIDHAELKFGCELASGNFGTVSFGEYQMNDCVIKELKDQSASARAELLREAMQLSKLPPHASICAFFGACVSDDPGVPLCLVTEYIAGGNLLSLLNDPTCRVTGVDVVALSKDLAAGLKVLHKNGILHLDLACRNLLVVSLHPLRLRICDFGLSTSLPAGQETVPADGCQVAYRWCDPLIWSEGAFSKASDTWSFAVCVWEMSTRARPYFNLETNPEVFEFVRGGGRLPAPGSGLVARAGLAPVRISDAALRALYEMCQECWRESATLRPTFDELANRLDELSSLGSELDSSLSTGNVGPLDVSEFSLTEHRGEDAYGPVYASSSNGSTTGEYGVCSAVEFEGGGYESW